ncbi:MAG TPA: fumarylacetoacetate hydrolase family protein [Caulobacteraceae bacterium]|jgi:fumarylpyruvate hydrolase
MSRYLFEPQPQPACAIVGDHRLFPVRRIFCVGRNYAAHAREMGADPDREPPFFFSKPADALVPGEATIPYPSNTADLHHEVELVVALHSGGVDIAPDDALGHAFGYAVGNDLTRRDRQGEMKKGGKPWEIGKAFDRSAQVGALTAAADCAGVLDAAIRLDLDGERRQSGRTSDLIWSVAETIAILSRSFELKAGDLIFTGTPEGVGPIARGQTVVAGIDGLAPIRLEVR